MIELLLLNKIIVLLINAIAVWIGFSVWRSNPKQKTNKIIIMMTTLMLFWIDFAYLARLTGDTNTALSLSFLKIAWFVTPLFFTFLYFLVLSLLHKNYKRLTRVIGIIGLCLSIITGFTNLIIQDTEFINNDLTIIYGKGMLPFMSVILFLMIITLYIPIKEYKNLSSQEKIKIQYFLIGIFVFYVLNIIFNISFPVFFKITRLYFFGDYSSIFLLGFTAYAIIKKRLFGLKVMLTQLFVGVLVLLLLVNLVTAQFLFEYIWKGALLIAFIIFGFLLIKSVQKEIKQKEELDKYANQLSEVNKKLEIAYSKLQKLDKAKSEFISIASHQLRTPLTAIKGYISMILEGDYGAIPKGAIDSIKNVFEANERIIQLVNSLLNLSRIEAGKIKLVKKKTQTTDIVADLIRQFRFKTKEKGLQLFFKKPHHIVSEINIDTQKITEVISNLMDNAIKYTQQGKITVRIKQKNNKETKKPESLIISVTDTGDGISKEKMPKLFQSFSRADAGSKHWVQGTGLGLYIAKKFITMHRGKIKAESPGKGQGSSFIIELPF